MRLISSLRKNISLLSEVLTVAAVCVGGAWVLFQFVYKEVLVPSWERGNIMIYQTLSEVDRNSDYVSYELKVGIENRGKIGVSIVASHFLAKAHKLIGVPELLRRHNADNEKTPGVNSAAANDVIRKYMAGLSTDKRDQLVLEAGNYLFMDEHRRAFAVPHETRGKVIHGLVGFNPDSYMYLEAGNIVGDGTYLEPGEKTQEQFTVFAPTKFDVVEVRATAYCSKLERISYGWSFEIGAPDANIVALPYKKLDGYESDPTRVEKSTKENLGQLLNEIKKEDPDAFFVPAEAQYLIHGKSSVPEAAPTRDHPQ